MATLHLLCVLLYLSYVELVSSICGDARQDYVQANSNCTFQDFSYLCSSMDKAICTKVSCDSMTVRFLDVTDEDAPVDRTCTLPIAASCNGLIVCSANSDITCDNSCHYRCHGNDYFARRSMLCDENTCNNDCPDDVNILHGFKCFRKGKECLIPQVLLYDDIADCDDEEDLCYTNAGQYSYSYLRGIEPRKRCFQCRGDDMLISIAGECDGIVDCVDLSDECICGLHAPSICDNVIPVYEKGSDRCRPGDVRCGDSNCVSRSNICDGNPDCSNQIDERNEYCGVTLPCSLSNMDSANQSCLCDAGCKTYPGIVCSGSIDGNCGNDSVYYCPASNEPFHCKNEDEGITGKRCDGIPQCTITQQDEVNCTDRFYCPVRDGISISIDNDLVCDFQLNCINGSDEMNCNDGRFYCDNAQPLFVRQRQVNNGRAECSDKSDECRTTGSNSLLFHSRQQLLENQAFFIIIWIMAFLAIVGNLIVIIQELRVLIKMRANGMTLSSLRANHILVLSLAISDLLMGVYLTAVGIAYERLKGVYCDEEFTWRSSSVCTWMGVTVLISSETSVITMVLLTSFRLYAVIKPFNTSSHPRTWLVVALAIGAWIACTIVAILPLTSVFRKHIPDTAFIPNNRFSDGPEVELDVAKDYAMRSLIYYYPSINATQSRQIVMEIRSANTWDEFTSVFPAIPRIENDLRVSGTFGYYSIHSVCIADFFPSKGDPYVALSLTLTVFNLLAFVYIACVYVSIYLKSFRKAKTSDDKTDAARMQVKIFRLVFTDFLTWIPICVLSLYKVQQDSFNSGTIYAVAAIILLPINSAINPWLYSNAIPKLFGKLADFAHSFNRDQRVNSVEVTMLGMKSRSSSIADL